MAQLVALAMPGSVTFVDELRRVWDDGDAALPLDPRLPSGAVNALLDALRPEAVVDADGERHRRPGGEPVAAGDAVVVATSGTTGEPRGVVLTHDAVRASALATSARLGVDAGTDRWLACLPLSHVGGLSVVMRALVAGTPLTVHPAFDAAAVDEEAERGATLVSLVPTALARIRPERWRRIVVGGAARPDTPPPNAVSTYGLTETGSGVVYDGVPLDGVGVRIDGGQILLRGPMLLRAYRDGTDPKDDDGWLPTGDLGALDDSGCLTVHGRADDLIVTGGENVWPDAVEAALRRHPGVADVAVAGRSDPEWGQRVLAFVVPSDVGEAPTLDQLRAVVKDVLPAYAAPRELVVVAHLPRTPLGKVRRSALPPP